MQVLPTTPGSANSLWTCYFQRVTPFPGSTTTVLEHGIGMRSGTWGTVGGARRGVLLQLAADDDRPGKCYMRVGVGDNYRFVVLADGPIPFTSYAPNNRCRPLARRRFNIFLPPTLLDRLRYPHLRFLRRRDG
jgi:hypothetical protein